MFYNRRLVPNEARNSRTATEVMFESYIASRNDMPQHLHVINQSIWVTNSCEWTDVLLLLRISDKTPPRHTILARGGHGYTLNQKTENFKASLKQESQSTIRIIYL